MLNTIRDFIGLNTRSDQQNLHHRKLRVKIETFCLLLILETRSNVVDRHLETLAALSTVREIQLPCLQAIPNIANVSLIFDQAGSETIS